MAFDIKGVDPSLKRIPDNPNGIRLGVSNGEILQSTVIPECHNVKKVIHEEYVDFIFERNVVSLETGHGATSATWFVDVGF
ncbi:MAG: hypothetical protein DRP09_20750 [Candidatus Thorarchaeota archaeon]|nr:MAG: hypothetical protein DRP09_20750 [Candidatus Thorarchaeota archaeon]